jgi:uncharacterized membrane protein
MTVAPEYASIEAIAPVEARQKAKGKREKCYGFYLLLTLGI